MLQVQAKSMRQIVIPHTAGTLSRTGRASATMAVHAAMQKMMPKFTESSTETSVVDPYDQSGSGIFGGTLDVVARESAHPAGNKQKYPTDAGAPDVLEDGLGKPGHLKTI